MWRLESNLILFFCVKLCFSFPPNAESAPEFQSHEVITRQGIYRAVGKYLERFVTGISGTDLERIQEYFSSDSDGLQRFESVIDFIVQNNNEVQKERNREAKISFNGEQIKEGHYELVSLRGKLEKEASHDSPDIYVIQKLIGQYLYTLQSFYSSTNWVEMRGVTVYSDLGLKDAELIDIAYPNENTCRNSYSGQKHLGHCPNNIIIVNKLTSGYKSGQDIVKPTSLQYDNGKCSHGGPQDLTVNMTANCGINKETSDEVLSPHNHFHRHAAEAAIRATEHFLSDDGSGLINTLGEQLFKELFNLRKKTSKSLAFVIDVTGSMHDNINVVKTVAIEKVKNPPYEPAYYALSTFSDPGRLTTGYTTEYSSNMIAKINGLIVAGGGDCPEYALSGLLKGIFLSDYKSFVFLFTDADAKDDNRHEEVTTAAIKKEIKIHFLLTGTCGIARKKRRSVEFIKENKHRYKRQSGFDTVFHSIANATGGTIHDARSGNLSQILETLLEASFPNTSQGLTLNQVNIDYISRPKNGSSLMQFQVDKSTTELQIQLTGVQSSQVDLMNPNAQLVNTTSNDTIWRTAGVTNIYITISGPTPGQWSIVPKLNTEIHANMTGQSAIDFSHKIMDQGDDGYLYPVIGNPIAGKSYTIVIKLIGDATQVSLSTLILTDLTGEEFSSNPLNRLITNNSATYTANVTMESVSFFFKIRGIDTDGNTLTRIQWEFINPVKVLLTLIPVHDDVLIGQTLELHYRIQNLGNSTESFLAQLIDNPYSIFPTSRNHIIGASDTIHERFEIFPRTSGSITYTIQVSLRESTEILQSITKYLHVTDVQHPICKIMYVEGNCPLSQVTPSNCSIYKWFAMTETMYSSISLSSVRLSNTDSNTQLYTGNTSSLYGPLQTNVSGTCCLDIVNLEILDTDGYLATCRLNFREDARITIQTPVISDSEVKNATSKGDRSDNSKMIGIAVGVSVAVVSVVVIIIVFKLLMNFIGSSAKVKDHSILSSTPKAADIVMNSRFSQSTLDQINWRSKNQTLNDS